jgi:uncharacterized protein (DUF433 family)
VSKDYIEERDGGYWIAATRISLDSIVYAFRRGASPESIQRSFPLLNLEQVHGAIAFYLAQRPGLDAYLQRGAKELERIRTTTRDADPKFHKKLQAARDRLPTKQP